MNRRLFLASSVAGVTVSLSGRGATDLTDHRFAELTHPIRWMSPQEAPSVVEIFWYGCQHCYAFEMALRRSSPDQPVWRDRLVRMPAMFDIAKMHAAAFFSAWELGVFEEFHWAFFRAIHEQGRSMRSDQEIARFFAALGIDRQRFSTVWSSSVVRLKLEQAQAISRQAKVEFVPWLVVNGRFVCSPRSAGGNEALLLLVDELLS